MKDRLSVAKALRTYNYMKNQDEQFKRKHGEIIERNRLNEIALENISKRTWVYMNCSHCGKMYLINFGDYLKKPLIYKDWVCYECEQKIIDEKLLIKHKTHKHWGRIELVYPDGERFFFCLCSDGTANGLQRRICDMLGRKMYEVD